METVIEIAIALLTTLGILAIGASLYGILVTPVRDVHSGRLYAVLKVEGDAPGMEQTVRSLKKSGMPNMEIILADAGMDDETHKIASLLAGSDERIRLCDISEVAGYIE